MVTTFPHNFMSCQTFSASVILFFISLSAYAQINIAVLDFELKDLTLEPNIPAEVQRTASIKPLLESLLQESDYSIVSISQKSQNEANVAEGYLFEHSDVAAQLGKTHQADYIVVGRLHKPSFLFVYLMVHLVDVKTGKLVGNYISESKGTDKKLTLKAVESLVVKINRSLKSH